MGFPRSKILAVSHFQSRIGSDQDYSDPESTEAQANVDGDEYPITDTSWGESGLKFRGMTEKKKKRRNSTTAAAPRPQPPYHMPSSSSASQSSYYPPSSQSAYAQGSAAYYPGLMQGSPPSMHNSTFSPSSQQYQNGNSQAYVYPNANPLDQGQGQLQQPQQQHHQYQQQQQQQQQPQHSTQGYSQPNNQYNAYGSFPNNITVLLSWMMS